MQRQSVTFPLPDEDATRRLAGLLGHVLEPGDTVLLDGEIGAGKTALARALIQSLQTTPEDVPSPTFTLVQVYDTSRGDIWHADLYRISSTSEIEELGLTDATETAICLIEWPERMGDLTPEDALTLGLRVHAPEDEARMAVLSWSAPRWSERMRHIVAAITRKDAV